MASTGGPVSGKDEADRRGWQSNTSKLESAGAMGIEYSLSCPQGGDGTEGDIVSQNAALTAKIVDWVMQVGDPDIPKLFKLSAAVTSIIPILRAIRKVLDAYPGKKAGITLANSFPTLALRPGQDGRRWEEGVVVGMSGEGVTPISNLSTRPGSPGGYRDLRQRGADDLQSRNGLPGPGCPHGAVLHHRYEAGLRDSQRTGNGDLVLDARARISDR